MFRRMLGRLAPSSTSAPDGENQHVDSIKHLSCPRCRRCVLYYGGKDVWELPVSTFTFVKRDLFPAACQNFCYARLSPPSDGRARGQKNENGLDILSIGGNCFDTTARHSTCLQVCTLINYENQATMCFPPRLVDWLTLVCCKTAPTTYTPAS